ncbi:MAG: FHA domain-containing protein [Planctomycetota bacterium]
MAKLIITEDGRDKIYEIADDVFTIGSGSEADLVLADESVSEIHLEVRKTPQGYRIVDLESKSGTVVNGQAVNQHVLGNGDTIEIGETRITYIGRGPAKKAAGGRGGAGRKKSNIDQTSRSHYRRETWSSSISGAGMFGIVIAIIAIVGLVIWLVLGSAGTDYPAERVKMRNALDALQKTPSDTSLKQAEDVHAEFKSKYEELSPDDQEVFAALQREIANRKKVAETVRKTQAAREDWARISNHLKAEKNDFAGRVQMCEAFLQNYGPETENYSDVQSILGRAKEQLANVTPEQRELADLEAKVNELVWSVRTRINQETGDVINWREYGKAYDLVKNASSALKAAHNEELEKMALKLRQHSRKQVTVRKNEVRHALREKDPAKANRMVDEMFDHLIVETIAAYLEFPDGGYSPDIQRLEEETQKLLRARLAREQR